MALTSRTPLHATSDTTSPTQRSCSSVPQSSSAARYRERDQLAEHLLRELQDTDEQQARDDLVDQIVRLHLDLCDGLAARYAGRSIPTEDLVQVARLALVVAVGRYRPGPGRSFLGYAVPTMTGELKRHFRDFGWMVRPPRRLQELGPVLRAAQQEWEQSHGTAPTAGQLAEEVGARPRDVAECLAADNGYHALSLDVTFGADESRPLADSIAEVQPELESTADRVTLAQAMTHLSPRDSELLTLRFVDGLTQKEIGVRLGVSQMQVSRLLRDVLERLRELMGVREGSRAVA